MQNSWRPMRPNSSASPRRTTSHLLAIFVGVVAFLAANRCLASETASRAVVRIKTETDVLYGEPSEPMHRADLFYPSDVLPNGKKWPVVLMIHGGAWTAGDKSYDRVHARKLAARGYCVVVINYRLAPTHKFPAQLDDCRLALTWIKSQAEKRNLDLDRIAAWGYSAGGHLTALLALTEDSKPEDSSPRLQVCVCGGAPFDLTDLPGDTEVLAGVFGKTPAQAPEIYQQASPISHVKKNTPPMFVFHGTKDWLVPNKNAVKMCRLLEFNKIDYEYCEVPGKGHLATFADFEVAEKSFDFLDKFLRPDSAWRDGQNQSK